MKNAGIESVTVGALESTELNFLNESLAAGL